MTHPEFQQPTDCNPNPEPLEMINSDDDPREMDDETLIAIAFAKAEHLAYLNN